MGARTTLAAFCLAGISAGMSAPAYATEPASADRRSSSIVPGVVDRTSSDLRATYDASATLDWTAGTIKVRSEAKIENTSGRAIDRLVLNSYAGALGDMVLLAAKVDGRSVDVVVEDQNLLVPLGGILPAGARTAVLIRYRATLGSGSNHPFYHWSRANGIISCLRWIPWVSRHDSFWRASEGQPYLTRHSPHVQVTLTADQPLEYATGGVRVSQNGMTQSFEAFDVLDFNFTAAPDFQILEGDSTDGETAIEVYSRTLSRQVMLDSAREAIAAFEAKLGEFPYPRLTISEASGGVAHESPGHIWLSATLSPSSIRPLVVHETAHQWFYALVGSDQPREPFADEAVAEFLTTWFLDEPYSLGGCPKDRLDRGIAYYDGCLYEVIYLQGSSFLERIREDIGDDPFWTALRRYVDEHRFQFGGTVELLETLREYAELNGIDLLPRYKARFPRFY